MRPAILTPFRVLFKRNAMERGSRLTRAELELAQSRRIARLRRFACERSPFYRQFHRGLENRPLGELPILTKATLMENFDNLVTDRSLRLADAEAWLRSAPADGLFRGRYVTLSTSGSTGLRGVFVFSPSEWLTALGNITRPILWSGLAARWGGPPRLAMMASAEPWHYSARVTASLSNPARPALRLDATAPLEEMVRQLEIWQPDVLAGYPSVLRQLAAEQIAGRLRLKLRGAATSAEVLTDETRRLIHQAWGVRVYDTYGATEYAPIAAECAYGRKHLFEDGAAIEIVDEAGREVPPGVSGDRILLTVFDRWTQPLIRYEIADRVRATATQCECGRAFRTIEAVEGRAEEVLAFARADEKPGAWKAHPNVFLGLPRDPTRRGLAGDSGRKRPVHITAPSARRCGGGFAAPLR